MKEIRKIKHLDATVQIPGSKSFTQRALMVAALADGQSILRNPLIADDTEHLMRALRALGIEILVSDDDIIVTGRNGHVENPGTTLFVGNNGTALRFLPPFVALGQGSFVIDGSRRLRERPVQPLLDGLRRLGVETSTENDTGYPPVTVHGGGIRGGRATFVDPESSQYLSSILISAPYGDRDVEIEIEGSSVSAPYIDMTVDVMNHFGVSVEMRGPTAFFVPVPQRYRAQRYVIESDASGASYFFLAAALCRGRVTVENLNPDTRQGDIGFLRILEEVGCRVVRGADFIEVVGTDLAGGDRVYDMGNMPDMVPTLAVLAAFRPGRTVITNATHLRVKESNRIESVVTELNRIGITARERPDGLVIHGGEPHGAEIRTYDDHRIAMSFAIAGCVTGGMTITDRKCVAKSFPHFWQVMDRLYQ
jgi:3-phosphoshikimate 1-carboxyvinyltransferase